MTQAVQPQQNQQVQQAVQQAAPPDQSQQATDPAIPKIADQLDKAFSLLTDVSARIDSIAKDIASLKVIVQNKKTTATL